MSISAQIEELKRARRLFPVLCYAPGTTTRRALLVNEELWRHLTGPWDTPENEVKFMELRAYLDVYTEGRLITPGFLFQLSNRSEEVWEIKAPRPRPGLRVFGRFAEIDVFVALHYAERDVLQGWQSRVWRDAKEICKSEWRKLFITWEPFGGNTIHDYVSNAVDGRYLKSDTVKRGRHRVLSTETTKPSI
jgi:hypothetical protein